MRYTFLLYTDPADIIGRTPEEWAEVKHAFGAYIGALKEAGVFVDTDRLLSVDTATTVSLKGGTKQVHDGPFADTKETLGGYFVVNVENLDEAMLWAEKCPTANIGKVEIRASAFAAE